MAPLDVLPWLCHFLITLFMLLIFDTPMIILSLHFIALSHLLFVVCGSGLQENYEGYLVDWNWQSSFHPHKMCYLWPHYIQGHFGKRGGFQRLHQQGFKGKLDKVVFMSSILCFDAHYISAILISAKGLNKQVLVLLIGRPSRVLMCPQPGEILILCKMAPKVSLEWNGLSFLVERN